jgi:hypothetical protein
VLAADLVERAAESVWIAVEDERTLATLHSAEIPAEVFFGRPSPGRPPPSWYLDIVVS